VRGLDSVATQKSDAVKALLANVHFAMTAPRDVQPLPITFADREDRKKFSDPLGYLVKAYRCWKRGVGMHPA
jgi:hypothetical protein